MSKTKLKSMAMLAQACEQLDALTHVLAKMDGQDAACIVALLRPINQQLQQVHEELDQ